MINAGTEDKFAQLSIPQLKNKVVCEEHFKPECFMNYKRDSLTKIAVPTEWVERQVPQDTSTMAKDPVLPVMKISQPVKRNVTPVIRETKRMKVDDIQPELMLQESLDKHIEELKGEMLDLVPTLMASDTHNDNEESSVDAPKSQSCPPVPEIKEIPEQLEKNLTNIETMVKSLDQKLDKWDQKLDTLLKNTQQSQPVEQKERGVREKKRQLFQSIKRHINPVMATLLGMELFGSADHDWQEDEKELAMDLHSLGETTYKFLRDDLRFRLPAISDVQKWKAEDNSDD